MSPTTISGATTQGRVPTHRVGDRDARDQGTVGERSFREIRSAFTARQLHQPSLADDTHKASPERAEVLKRAGLVMALTAWETYVEDRLNEEVQLRLRVVAGSSIGHFVSHQLAVTIKPLALRLAR